MIINYKIILIKLTTIINNPNSLEQAMDNLRNPFLTLGDISQKQDMRREQVQLELDKARQKINQDRLNNERFRKSID